MPVNNIRNQAFDLSAIENIVGNQCDRINGDLQRLAQIEGDVSNKEMFLLQHKLNQLSMLSNLMSELAKAEHDAKMAMIKNMRT